MNLYPLKFKPILKSIIWGGDEICKFKGITPEQDGIGESWEISSVKGNVSVVANGELENKNLSEIIDTYKAQLVGKKNFETFGNTFPLLIKFIDARDNLSIQVHPDDELAKKRHDSFGKTEMWYVINATPSAFLYSGFEKQMTPESYVKSIEDNTFVDSLAKHDVKAGDVFFLPAGRVHAIGAGTFIAEIQQTSNITYRIYDYNRKDANGNGRELHTELAKDAIDFKLYDNYKNSYTRAENQPVRLESCRYFTTNLLEVTKDITRDYSDIDSFVAYICMGGACSIRDDKGNDLSVKQGETILIPADTKSVSISPEGNVLLLETYV
ncbi:MULTISPECIES: type I phosphomannose isomerase catalytic subunit [unclassified Dysgonomonas]|jgi:mannose-6-phosphate isomerase|uniref:type I phosphomannose isomerase catalytic subunit n=1 Tax=unclassified Dysgonomonas TaxID=2630389 RepID=UPI0025C547B4|nr:MULTISPECIES: type I phosphomannose isomerase catalytic subunit [unclassified Dysgonomonas]MDR2003644.1 class I mannose-6-phosphate isomerase [Prevotella sp.]HMM01616.1 mannose-6-phosphate isomerase [Dysgonomonas sp.]